MSDEQLRLARRLLKEGTSVREVARTFSVNPATLYRMVAPAA
jgi:transposase-like protein